MATKHPNYQELAKEIEEKDAPLLENLIMYPKGIDLILDGFKLETNPCGEHRGTKVF